MKRSLFILLVMVLIIAGCKKIEPCGDFTFNGTEFDTAASNGVDMDVAFDFDPATCGSSCACDPVAYIQIVRTVDLETYNYLYPSSEKADRATADGWYIDRIAGKIWGYYGRNDDGTFAGYLTTGSESTDAILRDSPRRPEAEPWLNIWWQAISVPVCIEEESSCENQLLGYYYWSWLVDDGGDVTGIPHWVAGPSSADSVDEGVDEWNIQAPGLGKNEFPAFTRLTP